MSKVKILAVGTMVWEICALKPGASFMQENTIWQTGKKSWLATSCTVNANHSTLLRPLLWCFQNKRLWKKETLHQHHGHCCWTAPEQCLWSGWREGSEVQRKPQMITLTYFWVLRTSDASFFQRILCTFMTTTQQRLICISMCFLFCASDVLHEKRFQTKLHGNIINSLQRLCLCWDL